MTNKIRRGRDAPTCQWAAPIAMLSCRASGCGEQFGGTPAQREGQRRMKITGLRTFIVSVSEHGGNWVFVKVYTDQDGLHGVGEGTVTSKAQTVAAAIMEHERFLVGRDPSNIEFLWQAMYRYARWRGGPILNSAISAIEMALWDIKGK